MSDLLNLSLVEARDALATKKISSVELTTAYLAQMEAKRALNTYVLETPEVALAGAKASDARLQSGTAGMIEGIPLGIKDLFCTKGIRTTACSKILGNFVPTYESTVTQNLWDQGAVCLGKTNMDEFAMGSANLNSCFGPVENPWKRKSDPAAKLVPGGSSGGSAAAVSARMALATTASDTGGSIRQPAAFCGLVGIKPTYGLCSRWGMVAFASSLDQAGPMTRTVADSALMLQVMAGFDEKDAKSLNVAIPNYLGQLKTDVKGLRIGIAVEYLDGLSPIMLALLNKGIQWLKDAGAEIREVSLKTTSYALPTYYIIAPAEASANLARFDGVRYGARVEGASLDELYENTRSAGFGAEVKRRIMIGTYVLSSGFYDAYYIRAQKVKQLICDDFAHAFEHVDLLLTPTTPGAAFGIDETPTDPVTMYLQDVYTVTANLAGLPGISIPAGLDDDGLPLGLQLIGPALSEQNLFNAGNVIERAAHFPYLKD
ncbi:MAG: Asp-tRNA(Asn)/Glu-tRNA(Gln) amidotransferase subunit GatA [Pseudomonadota bacterium]